MKKLSIIIMMILITMQLIHSSEEEKKELNENGAIKLEYLGIMGYFVNQAFLNDYNLLSNDVEYKDLLINNYLEKEKLWEKAIKEYAKLQKIIFGLSFALASGVVIIIGFCAAIIVYAVLSYYSNRLTLQ